MGRRPAWSISSPHCSIRGTTNRSAQQFAQEVDFYGARFGAGADNDSVSVSISGLVKFLPKMLDLFSDAIFHPLFPADELAKEAKKVKSALAREKQLPSALAPKLRDKLVFGDHPYGDFETETTVDLITRDDLAQFHAQHFLANRATLAVVGDVKAAEILRCSKRHSGAGNRAEFPRLNCPPFPSPITPPSTWWIDPAPCSRPSWWRPRACRATNPDYPELSVVNSTLGGGFSGRLFQNLRERNGFTYGASSRFAPQQLGGLFSAGSDVRNAVTEPAVVEILNELKRIREQPIDEKELAMQRDYLAGNYLLSLENPGSTAVRVQEIEFFGLPADYYKSYARRVTSVTPKRRRSWLGNISGTTT